MSNPLIPKALTYEIRLMLGVSLSWDEAYFWSRHADLKGMSILLSLRANAGLAERIVSCPAGEIA